MRILSSAARFLSLLQLLIFLPLALDHDRDTFLAFSAALAIFYLWLSTLRWLTAGTCLETATRAVSHLQNAVIPLTLFFCAHVYAPLPSHHPLFETLRQSGRNASMTWLSFPPFSSAWDVPRMRAWLSDALGSAPVPPQAPVADWLGYVPAVALEAARVALSHVPELWYSLLLYLSPVFSLLEGFSSLLVIQSVAHFSRWLINEPQNGKRTRQMHANLILRRLLSFGLEPSEVWQLVFLLLSATVYVAAAVALYAGFERATQGRPLTAAGVGASVASTLWLSAIAFAIRKANVVETSLMFAYVAFNIYQLGSALGLSTDPVQMMRAFRASRLDADAGFLLTSPTSALPHQLIHAVEHSLRVLAAALEALPTTVIVSLVYRLTVLYSAIRILPRLDFRARYDARREALSRRQNQAWSAQHVPPRTDDVPEDAEKATLTRILMDAKEPGSANAGDVHAYVEGESHADERAASAADGARRRVHERDTADAGDELPAGAAEPHAPPAEGGAATRADGAGVPPAERPPVASSSPFLMVLVTYSRFLLIAVYSHLLLLDQNHQVYWRLLTVFFTLGIWSVELLLGKEDATLISLYE
ncbi:hypothetical protein MSPP1_000308 [Malassezia sp. CBS 17886]|nr:hypothetical protein MSPP1_000308 [Malassezia sp. CBS 17886]